MLKARIQFSKDQLSALMKKALGIWKADIGTSGVSISVDEKTQRASCNINVRVRGNKTITAYLDHETIVAGITEASAREGNAIDPASLEFKYIAGSGYGGGPSVSASASPSTADGAANAQAPGKVLFPGTITVHYGTKELEALLKSATERSGQTPGYISVSYSEQNGASANIAVKLNGNSSGSISLPQAELNQTLIEELQAQGYDAVADGIRYSYRSGGFGGPGGTSATFTLKSIPTA